MQLPSDIGLPPYLVGLCTRSVYGLADAPRRWWNRLDKFLISLGIQPTRADRCTYVCYDGAFKNDDVSSGTKTPKQTSYYVDSPSGEMTRDESFDIANEVRQSFAVEERLFSLCHAEGKSLYQQQRYIQKKSEDCAWTPVVDELLKFLESVEHKAGWIPYQNGHAQVSYRAKALRTPDPNYTSKQYFFRTSIVKRKGVWWLLEMNADIRKEKETLYHLKKKLKFLCLFFFLLNVHTLHPHHNSHLKLLKNCWNILWILCMVVTLKEGRPLVCVACMLMIFLSLVPQIFWRSSRVR